MPLYRLETRMLLFIGMGVNTVPASGRLLPVATRWSGPMQMGDHMQRKRVVT